MNKYQSFLEYLLVIWLVFEYFTMYMRLLPLEFVYSIGLILLFILCLISHAKINPNLLSIIIFILLSINTIFQKRILIYVLLYIIMLFLFYVYFNSTRGKKCEMNFSLFYKYSNVATVIAVVSLTLWVGGSILGYIKPTGIFPNNWGEFFTFVNSYYNVYFETYRTTFLGYEVQRNTAIFTEAPVCNLIFCFALAIELYMKRIKNKLKIFLLIIAIISTISTTGQFFLIFTFFMHTLLNKHRKVILFLSPIFAIIAYNIVNIIINDKSETGSYISRNEHIENMINTGLKNLITGQGILTYDEGISNSLFSLFAEGGLLMIGIYLFTIVFIPLKYYFQTKNKQWIMTNISFLFLFTFTVAYYKCLDIAIIAYAMSYSTLNKKTVNKQKAYYGISCTKKQNYSGSGNI